MTDEEFTADIIRRIRQHVIETGKENIREFVVRGVIVQLLHWLDAMDIMGRKKQ